MSPDASNCGHYRTARVPDGWECTTCGTIFAGAAPAPRHDGRHQLSRQESAERVRWLRRQLRDRRDPPPDELAGLELDPPHLDDEPWP